MSQGRRAAECAQAKVRHLTTSNYRSSWNMILHYTHEAEQWTATEPRDRSLLFPGLPSCVAIWSITCLPCIPIRTQISARGKLMTSRYAHSFLSRLASLTVATQLPGLPCHAVCFHATLCVHGLLREATDRRSATCHLIGVAFCRTRSAGWTRRSRCCACAATMTWAMPPAP